MKNYEFLVWLEGYLDVCQEDALDTKKLYIIKNHLNLVKAVEGYLGEFNTMIFNLVSEHLEKKEGYEALKQQLSDHLQQFLQDTFSEDLQVKSS